jgi:uncharacterized integral membrane protein (TIGR00698 family)
MNPDGRGLTPLWSTYLLLAIGGVAIVAARMLPSLSAVFVALVVGLVIANVGSGRLTIHARVSAFVTKRVLKLAVILVGAGFNLALLGEVGLQLIVTVMAVVGTAFGVGTLVGRAVRLEPPASLLIAVGTAICGVSAIAALAPLNRAKQDDIAVAVATIVSFNAVALVIYPLIGSFSGMDPAVYGMWAGGSIHDAASAIGAGFALGPESGEVATLTKLTRVLFLLPLLAIAAGVVGAVAIRQRDKSASPWRQIGSSVPWFVLGFAGMAFIATQGWLGSAADVLSEIGRVLIVFVIAGIALGLRIRELLRTGRRALLAGLAASIAVSVVALVTIFVFRPPE